MGLSEKTLKKHAKEKAEIDQQMLKFRELPTDYEAFVTGTVLDDVNYIFYSSVKGRAYCTRCGSEFEITSKLKHNSNADCPVCKKNLMCKSNGMSRQSLFAVEWSVLVQKYEESILIRYFRHTKDFRTDYHNPKVESCELYRTVHTDDKASDYEWGQFKSTDEYRWCNYKDRCGWWTPSEMAVPRRTVLYNTDLKKDIAGTCMRYSAVDIYVDKVVGTGRKFDQPWCLDWYFNSYRRQPYIEQLLKVGFFKLAKEVLESRLDPKFKAGRNIMEILGISKSQYKLLRGVETPGLKDIDILKYGQALSKEEFLILRSIADARGSWCKKYIDMRRYTTIYKLDKYMRQAGLNGKQNDYFDYIRWLEEMGYDMRNKSNLYPKNFQRAHDAKAKEYIAFRDKKAKEDREKFDLLLKELRENAQGIEAMNLKAEGIFIRLPYQLDEIKKEGETLHHCVGTYIDKVAKGETEIFFVRKESEPDKPYYTMEWKNNRIAQCRGFGNCDMTPEVKAFAAIFEEKMQKTADNMYNATKLKTAG